jgi:transposase-like protein
MLLLERSKPRWGEKMRHRTNRYLNNHLEQAQRAIKQRIRSRGSFTRVALAKRICQGTTEGGPFSARAHAGMRS